MELDMQELEVSQCLTRVLANLVAAEHEGLHPRDLEVLSKQLADTASAIRALEGALDEFQASEDAAGPEGQEEYMQHFQQFEQFTKKYKQVAAQYHALEVHKPHLVEERPPVAQPVVERPVVQSTEEKTLPAAGSTEGADGWDVDDGLLFDELNEGAGAPEPAAGSDQHMDEYVHVDQKDASTPPKHNEITPTASPQHEEQQSETFSTPAVAPIPAPPITAQPTNPGPIVPAAVVQSAIAASLQASEREQLLGGVTDRHEEKDDDAALMRTRALLSAEIERMSAVSTLLSQDHGTLIGTQEQHAAYSRESAAALENVRIVKEKERRDRNIVWAAFAFLFFTVIYITSRRMLWIVGIKLP